MKERQRWQPEEDALLRAYVKQYGPKEWNLVSQRMGKPLDRDAKSCLERWKNYLKPGIKKGSLTDEEQSLVISLQAKYGNKWKKIAAEVPGRTAKRLGKWWEVFKEKQLKEKRKQRQLLESCSSRDIGRYDHILETFAEKYVQRKICPANLPPLLVPCPSSSASSNPLLSLGGPTSTGEAAFSDKFLSNLKSPTTTREAAFSDSFLSNLKSPPPATAAAEMSMPQMENGSVVAVGPSCLSELKGKVIPASGSDMGPALTLESLGGTTRSTQQLPPEPKLALQCNASAMELDLSSASLGSSAFVDSNSSLPAWMSTAPPPPPPVSQSTSALPSCSASRATADKEATFLSKTVHINTSPSVSLSLSPTSSELIVSSGSASPASEVVAPRSWLQELNGASGAAVFKETKVNLPWCFSEKQIGLLSLEPGHSHSNRLGFRSPTDPARMSLEAASDDPLPLDPSAGKQNMENMILQQLSTFLQYCKDLEESRHSWFMHKKEATWRLNRLEQQLESEKARKRREKIEEIGAKIRALREEEMVYLEKLDSECKEQLCSLQKEAEMKEAKMVELWAAKHLQLTKFIEQMVCQCSDVQRLVKNDMK